MQRSLIALTLIAAISLASASALAGTKKPSKKNDPVYLPEPAGLVLIVVGVVGIATLRRRKAN